MKIFCRAISALLVVTTACVVMCQDIKTSVCQCEDAVNELYQRAQKVSPLVLDTDRQPCRHVSATTLCSYRPLNVRCSLVSVFTVISCSTVEKVQYNTMIICDKK